MYNRSKLFLRKVRLFPLPRTATYLHRRFRRSWLACRLAAFTDLLDGYLARKLGQTSKFGAFLDPVADKLLVAVCLVLLVQSDARIEVALIAAVIIGREITVSALREWMASLGARSLVKVGFAGKLKTLFQMVVEF